MRSLTPLLSSSGRILRQPFEDVSKPKALSKAAKSQPIYPEEIGTTSIDDDEIVAWINPITKVRSIVNKRSGLTIAAGSSIIDDNITRSVTIRPFTSRLKVNTTIAGQKDVPSSWLSGILKRWDNPVFLPTEASIPQVSLEYPGEATRELLHGYHHHCTQSDVDQAFKDPLAIAGGRISKLALKNAEVVSQVDKKFILVKVAPTTDIERIGDDSRLLILVDQHAADERIRIEILMEELCTPHFDSSSMPTEFGVLASPPHRPLAFDISSTEVQLLRNHQQNFAKWGILLDLPSSDDPKVDSTQRISVLSLPVGILERCQLHPRLLIDLIRTEIHNVPPRAIATPSPSDWLQRISSCPQGIIEMLNSRACRSAIMFNDELSLEQCGILVSRLAQCRFPFICAHGRPSLVPLIDLGRMGMGLGVRDWRKGKECNHGFGTEFRRWKEDLANEKVK